MGDKAQIRSVNSAWIKFNVKTNKWDVKFLINGKIKWVRGFDTESSARICAEAYFTL